MLGWLAIQRSDTAVYYPDGYTTYSAQIEELASMLERHGKKRNTFF